MTAATAEHVHSATPVPTRPQMQASLKLGAVDDPLEREAEAVAEQILRMPDAGPSLVRRCPTGCSSQGSIDKPLLRGPSWPQEGDDQRITARRSGTGALPSLDPAAAAAIDKPPHGRALPLRERSFFEPRLGADLSRVRVHVDQPAAALTHALHARALTVGGNIFFGAGQWRPTTQQGRRLLAHELTHVLQQGPARRECTDPPTNAFSDKVILPYRPKGSPNFGTCDDPPRWVETPFTDEDNDPWIDKITVAFDGTTTDSDGDLVPTGQLSATYHPNAAALSPLTGISIVGGKASQGLTDQGSNTVKRIEGCGYHHTSVPKAERVTGHKRGFKYFKPGQTGSATMSFAIFFLQGKSTGNQAIHEGSLDSGSLACVHIGTTSTIRQINYHSRVGKTRVEVTYGAGALEDVCCARYEAKGYMVSNPCRGQDPKKCP